MDWYSMSSEASASMEAGHSEISSDASQVPITSSSDFFETLEWTQRQQVNAARPPPPPPPLIREVKPRVAEHSANLFSAFQSDNTQTGVSSPSGRSSSSRPRLHSGKDVAEAYERHAGIRVGHVPDPDADQYKFDCEKETPILSAFTPPCAPLSEFDLLDLGTSGPSNTDSTQAARSPDPFSDLLKESWSVPTAAVAPSTDDLLGDWPGPTLNAGPQSAIHRNVSAPAFQPASATLDPFAEFLTQSASNPTSAQASTSNSGSNTPKPTRPNYSRTAFESLNSNSTAGKARLSNDTFGDLLSSQGFTTSGKNINRTLGDLKRAEEIKEMDPVSIKIRDWVGGKERNIRALLGSLNDVLWDGAEKWQQPSMADLLTASQVKRSYYKACLVVHPDKQVGQEHEKLARAIFTELNDAWNAFEQSGSQSL